MDNQTNIELVSASYNEPYTTLRIRRKLITTDSVEDVPIVVCIQINSMNVSLFSNQEVSSVN